VTAATGSSHGECGGPCASTGVKVFGGHEWQFGIAVFRAEFLIPTDFASIDFVGLDDGSVQAFAYDTNDVLIGNFFTHIDRAGQNETAAFSRSTADIAYILASGILGETVGLDNLRYNSYYVAQPSSVPEPSALGFVFAAAVWMLFLKRRQIV
jgi:hypothetical protein